MVGKTGAISATLRARRRPRTRSHGSKTAAKRIQASSMISQKSMEGGKCLPKFSTEGPDVLNRSQVKALLAEVSNQQQPPSNEEVDFILKICEGSDEDPDMLERSEVQHAVEAWATYIEQRDMLQATLDEYDTSGSGKLEKDELEKYLKHLNGDMEVSDEEVDWVWRQADVFCDGALTKPGLLMATAAWYIHVDHVQQKQRDAERKKSKMCSIS
mmetsp:Transcript_54903/g.139151  ORF Transcript_54903/g.139151 Transcript_54903/m.139151 type:complete len:214 (-) Transcript_54903:80-721(-)